MKNSHMNKPKHIIVEFLTSATAIFLERGNLSTYGATESKKTRGSSVQFDFRNAANLQSDMRRSTLLVEVMGYKFLIVSTFIVRRLAEYQ